MKIRKSKNLKRVSDIIGNTGYEKYTRLEQAIWCAKKMLADNLKLSRKDINNALREIPELRGEIIDRKTDREIREIIRRGISQGINLSELWTPPIEDVI